MAPAFTGHSPDSRCGSSPLTKCRRLIRRYNILHHVGALQPDILRCCAQPAILPKGCYPVLRSCDADGLRTSQLQHAVEGVDGSVKNLGQSACLGPSHEWEPEHS